MLIDNEPETISHFGENKGNGIGVERYSIIDISECLPVYIQACN